MWKLNISNLIHSEFFDKSNKFLVRQILNEKGIFGKKFVVENAIKNKVSIFVFPFQTAYIAIILDALMS